MGQVDVDAGRDEDRGDRDAEILADEERYPIWVYFGGEGAEDIADDLENACDYHRNEGPVSITNDLQEMCNEENREEDDSYDVERECWDIARGILSAIMLCQWFFENKIVITRR